MKTELSKVIDAVVAVYALMSIVIGTLGYVAPSEGGKPSLISMIAGVGLGAILIGSLALGKSNPRAGRMTAAVVSLLLVGRFMTKAFEQVYPAGIMFVGGVIALGFLVGGHLAAMQARKTSS